MIFWTSMSFCHQSWMPYGWKDCNNKIMSSFLLPHYHLLIKCTTIIWLQFFSHKIKVISYDYNQLCSCLGLLVIDFLIAKDKIPSNGTTNDQPLTMVCYNSIPKDFASKKYQSIMMFETMQWIFSWKTWVPN
jgi:hypothetical protein